MTHPQQAGVRNLLLTGLSADDFAILQPNLEPVVLALRHFVVEAGTSRDGVGKGSDGSYNCPTELDCLGQIVGDQEFILDPRGRGSRLGACRPPRDRKAIAKLDNTIGTGAEKQQAL